ncbi:MAG: hypothetical protein LUC21_07310 [Oscillospiraceae bacterium]|nr:hypothetical protein [Oscillospiraceae bacterium]
MELKLYDSELKVMKALWQNGELRANRLAKLLTEQPAGTATPPAPSLRSSSKRA